MGRDEALGQNDHDLLKGAFLVEIAGNPLRPLQMTACTAFIHELEATNHYKNITGH